jgi:hypothetical protein
MTTTVNQAATTELSIAESSSQAQRNVWRLPIIALGLITFLYLLLQNPYWIRYGDSELYLSVARSIARGQGYRYNGEPVAIVTPAWPLILAAAMKISTKMIFLKMLPMVAMLGFFVISAVMLLEYTSPRMTAICLVTAAILQPVQYLSYMFFSDALFSLVGLTAVWLGLRIARGHDSWGSIALLVVACIAAMLVRWAALPWFVVIAGAVLEGEFWPKWNRKWIAFALATAATIGTFLALRVMLRVAPSQLDLRYDTTVAGEYDLVNATSANYLHRFTNFGQWLGGLLWRFGQNYRILRGIDNLAGWSLSLLIAWFIVIPAIKQRRWLWVGMAAYVALLGADWPNALARYIVPLAPFVIFAAYQATKPLIEFLRSYTTFAHPHTVNLLLASILLVNGGVYVADVIVMRMPNFYHHYEGGAQESLIYAGAFLIHQPPDAGEIAISQRLANLNREMFTAGFFRALNFLADRNIMMVPQELCREPDADLIAWLTKHHVRYYLYQPPMWVVGNVRLRSYGGVEQTDEKIAWRMYEIKGGKAQRIALPAAADWPLAVPGL